MEHYIDIKILPDPEFKSSMLMGALFNKFHRALAELKNNSIAVSFPEYQDKTLGKNLRIHGDKQSLEVLMRTNFLKGMNDHIRKTNIELIPDKTRFISVRRKQNKYANIARLRRRYMKRHQASEAEAHKALPDTLEKEFSYPYINIKSTSTKQAGFPFYIDQKETGDLVQSKDFNSYGLSKTSTVPWF